ncbi:MAG: hypothetical protein HY286_19150 [Planctomycetes bacterium]|nr:hypothetical protein [Planctomycetota bacterium]
MNRNATHDLPVLIFGTSVTALGALRVFARRGTPAWVHTIPGDLVTLSRYYRPAPLPADFAAAGSHAARLESILRSAAVERAFLLPCTDLWTEAAAALPEDLKLRFPASLAPRETIQILLDKGKLADVMAALELPHPRSFAADRPEDFDAVPDRVFASAFLKPKSSAAFIDKFKVKALHVRSREEARARFRDAKNANCEVILQEYVPGPPTEHFFIDGFVDVRGDVRARFARQRLRMYPADFGNSTFMRSVAIARVAPAFDALQILLKHLNYRGIYSAEYKRDPRDGKFYLLEVNVRPWWYVDFAESCGVPVCEMAYADALGLPLPETREYPAGKTCVYTYFDMQGYFWQKKHHPSAPRDSFLSHVGSWFASRHPIFAGDDPRPAVATLIFLIQRWLKNKLWLKRT